MSEHALRNNPQAAAKLLRNATAIAGGRVISEVLAVSAEPCKAHGRERVGLHVTLDAGVGFLFLLTPDLASKLANRLLAITPASSLCATAQPAAASPAGAAHVATSSVHRTTTATATPNAVPPSGSLSRTGKPAEPQPAQQKAVRVKGFSQPRTGFHSRAHHKP